jgi:flagellar motility protein MotE (MotC chaperone)
MRKRIGIFSILLVMALAAASIGPWTGWSSAANQAGEPKPAGEETPSPEQQLAAREAALVVREQKLNTLSVELDSRARELESSRTRISATLEEQKKLQADRAKKTLKIYRSLRAEESAKLLDKLDEGTATQILNALDQKTVTQLIPYLNQPRVLKWTKETLAGK